LDLLWKADARGLQRKQPEQFFALAFVPQNSFSRKPPIDDRLIDLEIVQRLWRQ